jgi:hypothetical protein
MIASSIRDLEQYIISAVGVNCHFGKKDNANSSYPLVEIKLVDDLTIYNENSLTTTVDLPLELRLIVAEENELKALEVLEGLLLKMNQYKAYEGNKFEGKGTPEYVDETKTYEISLSYNLKQLIQDT